MEKRALDTVVSTYPESRGVTMTDGKSTIVARITKGDEFVGVSLESVGGVIRMTTDEIQRLSDIINEEFRELNPEDY